MLFKWLLIYMLRKYKERWETDWYNAKIDYDMVTLSGSQIDDVKRIKHLSPIMIKRIDDIIDSIEKYTPYP